MSDIKEKGSQGQTRLMTNNTGDLSGGAKKYDSAVANLNNQGFQLYIEQAPHD